MFSLSSNIMSQNAAGYVTENSRSLSKSMSKLSSGLRINSAADDASGLAVREILRADIEPTAQALRNMSDAISMLQTTDGVTGMLGNTLKDMKTIITQVKTGTYSDAQKSTMQRQFDNLSEHLAEVAKVATFNGHYLLVPGARLDFTIGAGESISMEVEGITIDEISDIVADPGTAGEAVDAAIEQLATFRGALGATAKRLESAASVAKIKVENLMAAESRISDVDVAKETARNTSNMISMQMSIAALSQANSLSKMVLTLLE